MEFVELKAEEFREYALHHDLVNFWQTVEMAELRIHNGWEASYVGLKDNGVIKAATMLSYRPLFMGKTIMQAMRGYLIDFNDEALLKEFHNHLIAYAKTKNCLYLKVDPYIFAQQRDALGEVVEGGFDHRDIVERLKKLGYHHGGYTRGYDDVSEPRWLYYRNLDVSSEEELLKSFDQQTRWSINKTLKMGIQIHEVTYEELKDYKKMMDHTSKRRGFIDHTMHYYEGMYKIFKQHDMLKILFAQLDLNIYEANITQSMKQEQKNLQEIDEVLKEQPGSKKYNKKRKVSLEAIQGFEKKLKEIKELRKDGDVITLAGSIFIPYGKEVMYLFSGAYDEYMRFDGPYALQWHMMKYALHHGFERYNFYGISGIFEKDAPDYGIYEFKNGFKGEVAELIGDFTYIVSPFHYKLYQTLRGIKHKIKG